LFVGELLPWFDKQPGGLSGRDAASGRRSLPLFATHPWLGYRQARSPRGP
jgi:hypothetical protein